MGGGYGITMALGYAWFDSYDSVGYVVTLHISPHTDCPYLPIAKRAFFGTEGFFLPLKMRAFVIGVVVADVPGVTLDVDEGDTTCPTFIFSGEGFEAEGADSLVLLWFPDP